MPFFSYLLFSISALLAARSSRVASLSELAIYDLAYNLDGSSTAR